VKEIEYVLYIVSKVHKIYSLSDDNIIERFRV